MKREVLFGSEAKEKLKQGAKILHDAVSVTLGASGRYVVIQKHGFQKNSRNELVLIPPHVTKDGATVAESIIPPGEIEAVGASLLRQAATKTADDAGDATTTATVIGYAMIEMCIDAVNQGHNPVKIKQGIESGVHKVVEELKKLSKPVENQQTLKQVATISANNDEYLGELISDVVGKVGKHGVVKIEDSSNHETKGTVIEGMIIESGYTSPHFVTNQGTNEVEYYNPLIMVADMEFSRMTSDMIKVLEQTVINNTPQPFVLISRMTTGDVEGALIMNKIQKNMPWVAINAPNMAEVQKDIMLDICAGTGATLIGDALGRPLKEFNPEYFGTCEKIIVKEGKTVIIRGYSKEGEVDARVKSIETQMDEAKSEAAREVIKRRIANLKDGVGVVYVGCRTQSELLEKKDRVEDAVRATMAAQEEGVVAGGGSALYHIAQNTQTEDKGEAMVYAAIKKPMERILDNAGMGKLHVGVSNLIGSSYGIGVNVKTGEEVNMLEAGIIDPTKVTRVALENAASVAILFLTTECVSYESKGGNA